MTLGRETQVEVAAGSAVRPVAAGVGSLAQADPGDVLRSAVALRQLADSLEDDGVGRALASGWTWARIAESLNVSRQAVHKKHFSRLEQSGAMVRRRKKHV